MSLANTSVSRRAFVAGLATLAAGSLAACGASGDTGTDGSATLVIGATPSPHAEILSDFAAPRLEERGVLLDVREYTDYPRINADTAAGELDANYYQHINYLNNYNEENGTDLVSVGEVHFEPMGVFAGRSSSLDDIADGAVVSVPNDPTNEGRALMLLQDLGILSLAEGAGVTATVTDITENPHNLEILEQEAAALPSTLADVDFSVINGNYAIDAGLSLADAVATESADSTAIREQYVNVIATRPELEGDKRLTALVEVLRTDEFKQYLVDTFGDAVQAAF